MAKTPFHQVRSEALELPDRQRAELARDLIASLDGRPDAGASTAWDDELMRRAEALANRSTGVLDRAEFSRRMRERLSRL